MTASDPRLSEAYREIEAQPWLHRYKTIIDLLAAQCPPGGKVADVGAWPGSLCFLLQQMGWSVVAIDKDPGRAVGWDRRKLLRSSSFNGAAADDTSLEVLCRQAGVDVVQADIERDPLLLESGSLDAVILTEVIEHLWHDPVFALSEINRVLKSDSGILILSTPNLTSLRHRISFALGHIERVIEHPFVSFLKARRMGHYGHIRLYAPQELMIMLDLLGFEPAIRFTPCWDFLPRAPQETGPAGPQPAPPGRLVRLGRKLIRSPAGYWSALRATMLDLAEKWVPRFRPQIFIIARKVKDADFEKNHPAKVEQIVSANTAELTV